MSLYKYGQVLLLLAFGSIMWTFFSEKGMSHMPSLSPENPQDVDTTFGYLTSYMLLPLLIVSEDRKDYSKADSVSPSNTSESFKFFAVYGGTIRYIIGLITSLALASGSSSLEINLDPFKVILICCVITTSVCSKMTTFLYKFTESHVIALMLPCFMSLVIVLMSQAQIGNVNSVANYVGVFLAY